MELGLEGFEAARRAGALTPHVFNQPDRQVQQPRARDPVVHGVAHGVASEGGPARRAASNSHRSELRSRQVDL